VSSWLLRVDKRKLSFKSVRTQKSYPNNGLVIYVYGGLWSSVQQVSSKTELWKASSPESVFHVIHKEIMSLPKTVLCKFFMNGFCKNGQACSYAHGYDDMIDTSKVAQYSVVTPAKQGVTCRNILMNGHCPFGDNCKFTHYEDDLRVSNKSIGMDASKFKTKVCIHWLNGCCNRGVRCNFIHKFETASVVEFPTLQEAQKPKPIIKIQEPKIQEPKTVLKTKASTDAPPLVRMPVSTNYWDTLAAV